MSNSFESDLAILGEGVVFGPGRIAILGAEVVARAGAKARVLMVADAGVAAAGLTRAAEASLADAGVTVRAFTDVRSDPLAAQIDGAVQAAHDLDANMIVGLGGGSAVDVAKMVAGVASGTAPAESYALQSDPFGDGVLPIIAVPTTAVREPRSVEARSAMIIAAALAGRAIDSGGTTIAHALGHALGAIGHVHHGRSVGLCLRVALPSNVEAAPGPHAEVARAFGVAGDSDTDLAAALPSAFDAFLREVGLRIDVADSGLKPEDAERLTAEAMKPENEPMRKATLRPIEQPEMLSLARVLLAAG